MMRGLSKSPFRAEAGLLSVAETLPNIKTTRVLVLYGDQDDMIGAADFLGLPTNLCVTFEVAPGFGHLGQLKKERDVCVGRAVAFFRATFRGGPE